MTEAEIRLQYVDRTWHIDFPEDIEQALEDDYVVNTNLYTDSMFSYIQTILLIAPTITPKKLIEMVHRTNRK